MKTLVILIFVLCTAPPFAFYVCYAALTHKNVPPGFIKAYGWLILAILALSVISFEGIDWPSAGVKVRGIVGWLRWIISNIFLYWQ